MTAPEMQMVDPKGLIIDTNVRLDAKADKSLISSIKQHGVLQAITGQAAEDGAVHVRMGQRRTLAAIEAGRESVPVMVLPADDDEARRIIEQMAENDHRAAITDNDRRAAVDALTGLGLSAAQIQRRTNRPKAEVAAAITVNESESAREGVETASLTLEQGAVLAEFEGETEAVESLMKAAAEGRGFAHRAQQLRDERAREAIQDAQEEELRAKGVTVLTLTLGDVEGHPNAAPLHSLINADDRSEVRAEDHDTCKGHAAAVRVMRTFNDDQPWRTSVSYYCTDPKACGHIDRYADPAKKKADEMSEEEREEAKAQRREVIDNNKAWASAETVRREWVAQYLTRKTAPKDAAPFVALALAKGWAGADVGHHGVDQMLDTLNVDASPEAVEKASNSRTHVLTLARVLAAYEQQTDRNDWRHQRTSTRDYLTWIAAQGYDLSEVEQRAAATD